MNPATREQKKDIVKILNDADVDPATGDHTPPVPPFFVGLTLRFRGRDRTPIVVSYSPCRDLAQRFQARCAKRPYQDIGSVHWRDKVGFDSINTIYSDLTQRSPDRSPAQLADAEIPFVILGTFHNTVYREMIDISCLSP